MSQQNGGYPPPPTSTPAFNLTRRQYAERPSPILPVHTRSAQDAAVAGSPISTPLSPMFSPAGIRSNSSNPAMASRAYNPQQWSQANSAGSSHVAFSSSSRRSTTEVTGMEGCDDYTALMPSPPPPYTPPPDSASRHGRPSPSMAVSSFAPSPLSAELLAAGPSQRSSPSHAPTAHFPPPPTLHSRERSVSGAHRDPQRAKFSFSGLAARVKRSDSSDHVSDLGSVHLPTPPFAAPAATPTAPSSRRAASTGAIMTTQTALTGRVSPESAPWEPGMPLPPPPPGPPPPGNRSQSLNRYVNCASAARSDTTNNPPPQPTRRRHQSTLGAVPPTPSDWVPEDYSQTLMHSDLRINTGKTVQGSARGISLTRQPATKETGTDSIRARRSRSRAKREGQEIVQQASPGEQEASATNMSRPTNLAFSSTDSLLQRRRAVEASSSRSSPIYPSSPGQARRQPHGQSLSVLTPPYTPATSAPRHKEKVPSVPDESPSERLCGPESDERPLSHILHAPIEEQNIPKPLDPQKRGQNIDEASQFTRSSLERYGDFAQQEADAGNDRKRLELFASFMVHESRIRRDRYAEAFSEMAGEIMELTRDLWRPLSKARDTNDRPEMSRKTSSDSVEVPFELDSSFQNSASSVAELTPATEPESIAAETAPLRERSVSNPWGDRFRPSLSPIPSMAVSTVPDEESSRGRSASRWWEESADGSGGHERRLERTDQETKYMSLHPQELIIAVEPSPNQTTPTPGTSKQAFRYGPNEYPPEKLGGQENTSDTISLTPSPPPPPPPPASLVSPRNKAPMTMASRVVERAALDVSRLVTLPPSYPRHYPAVNNSHPTLSSLRADHRAIADLSSVWEIIQDHEAAEASRRQAWRTSATERLQRFRYETQESINKGDISYAEAGQAELAFRQAEADKVIAQSERQSDEFRLVVADPVGKMLTERLQACNSYIAQLTEALDAEARCDQSMLAQTEGDERPELVEQLTLLKWLFESREHIYKEQFDVDNAQMTRESGTVLTHYRQAQDEAQVRRIEQQLGAERQKRQLQYATQIKQRFDSLQDTVEKHVSRGVEIQLSAFWDIAPGLAEVVHKVPQDLHGFKIDVPSSELSENGAYHDFPMQYLFTILNHANRSAYQFIEAQVNLLCLLHEVHTATASASMRLMEVERSVAGEVPSEVQVTLARAKKEKERELTEDLKDKVGEVEGQWREALGSAIENCIERVRLWLQESGGWDQSLEAWK